MRPVLVLSAVVCTVCFVACGGKPGNAPTAAISTADPVRDIKPGEVVTVGDFKVHFGEPRSGATQFSDFSYTSAGFLIGLTIANTNPNRVLSVQAQSDYARMSDDVGNSYPPLTFHKGSQPTPLRDQILAGHSAEVRSEKPTFDIVFFDKPVQGAKTLTLLFSTRAYGGSETLRLTVPK